MCCTRNVTAFWFRGFSFGTSASEDPSSEQGLNVPYSVALSLTLAGLAQATSSSGLGCSRTYSPIIFGLSNDKDACICLFMCSRLAGVPALSGCLLAEASPSFTSSSICSM